MGTVYERARPQGATLDLHEESGLRAIREAGLAQAFSKITGPVLT
ncbi:hypothetical protein [Siphonobacter sp.]